MKKILISMILAAVPYSSFAGGFDCPQLNQKIELTRNETGETILVNPNLKIPLGNDIDTYQDRWYIYNLLIEQATIRFPYMPETLLVYHVMRSSKLYRDGFKQLDDPQSSKWVKLPKMYCKALLAAINEI